MLREDISTAIKQAMKARDQVQLDALRYFWSQIRNAEIDAKTELDDPAVISLLAREVKRREEAISQMQSSGRTEMVPEEEAKLSVLKAYLPAQLSQEAVMEIVKEVMSQGVTEFGPLMGQVMAKLKGQADGALVQRVVKSVLSSQ